MKGVLLWLVRWGCLAITRDFFYALAALVGSVQNIFSSLYTISILYPLLGRQPCWVACLLVHMCLWACQRMIQNRSSELYNFLQPWECYSLKTTSAAQAMVFLLTGQELHSCELLAITATAVLVYELLNMYICTTDRHH
jgi:hypothetical protein